MMTKEEAIRDIVEDFNFERIHKVMVALNWTWFTYEGIPDIPALKATAIGLLNKAADAEGHQSFGTGGFVAKKIFGILSLDFNVCTWSVAFEVDEENDEV